MCKSDSVKVLSAESNSKEERVDLNVDSAETAVVASGYTGSPETKSHGESAEKGLRKRSPPGSPEGKRFGKVSRRLSTSDASSPVSVNLDYKKTLLEPKDPTKVVKASSTHSDGGTAAETKSKAAKKRKKKGSKRKKSSTRSAPKPASAELTGDGPQDRPRDNDANVTATSTPAGEEVVKKTKSRRKAKKYKGHCKTCRHFFEDLASHYYLTHQADGNREHAESYGLTQCACGWFGKSLKQHWKTCALPRGEQRKAPAEEASTDDPTSQSPWRLLFDVLGNDDASLTQIVEAFEVLARVPQFSKIWLPGEARIIRTKLEGLCDAYCSSQQPITLFRIMALQKVGCNPVFTKNRMGALVKRLRAYPKVAGVKQLEEWEDRAETTRGGQTPSLRNQVHKLLQQGRLGSAARLLDEGFGLAPLNDTTNAKLELLHPKEEVPNWPHPVAHPLDIREADVAKALLGTSRETSGGPSGFDGNTIRCVRRSQSFIKFLLVLIRSMVAGTLPLRECLLAARLIPLNKDARGDGVRPIAVSDVLYRICAKTIVRRSALDLLPNQLGVNSRNGVEPAIHFAREHGKSGEILAFDLKNAFNSMKRSWLYGAVQKYSPDLLAPFVWAYETHTPLFVGGKLAFKSQSGVKQGDPLAPALYSLGMRRIIEELIEALAHRGVHSQVPVLAYLDDLYVFGAPGQTGIIKEVVSEVFERHVEDSGMVLRPEKTITVTPEQFVARGFSILGSHVGAGSCKFGRKAVEDLAKTVARLDELQRQDAFLLLSGCLKQRLTHLLRTLKGSSTVWKQADQVFLGKLRDWTRGFGKGKHVRALATLPVRLGGLGFTLPGDIATDAFKASWEESMFLLQARFPGGNFFGADAPRPKSQRERTTPLWKKLHRSLQDTLSPVDRNTFIDLSSPLGRKVMYCLPVERRMTFTDLEWSAVLAEKLLFQKLRCVHCRIQTGAHHAHTCSNTHWARTTRHSAISQWVAEAVKDCNGSVKLEPQGQTARHRADLLLGGEIVRGQVAVDFSVCDTVGTKAHKVRSKHRVILGTSTALQAILKERADAKKTKYRGVDFGATFQPLVFTTGGTVDSSTDTFLGNFRSDRTHAIGYRLDMSISCSLRKSAAQAMIACFYKRPPQSA